MRTGTGLLIVCGVVLAGLAAVTLVFHQDRQPYAGLESREIKSLSESDVAGLREGQGLGYALAAELNGYPGPRHVLELSRELKLNDAQARKTQALFDQMKSEAVRLGEQLIAAERELDAFFAGGKRDTVELSALAQQAAAIDGALRATHLKFHIAMIDVLTPEQIEAYVTRRGNGGHRHAGH